MTDLRRQEPERVGVLGGTFDPIHVAHLALGIAAVDQLRLDRLLYVVANDPWQKTGTRRITPAEQRFAMVVAAVEHCERLVASRVELDRGGPSYTIDTLSEVGGPATELYLVIGSDIVDDITTWHRWEDLASLCTIAVAQRPGDHVGELPSVFRSVRIDLPLLDISSTELRAMARDNKPLDFLVPDAVRDSILTTQLYRDHLYRET